MNIEPKKLDLKHLLSRFPNIELSYDTILHKKVYSDVYVLIPKGIKVFAWFTYYGNKNLCVILHLNKNNKIVKLEEIVLCFDKSLSYGTIIYGTYFKIKNIKYFSCEDICYYKNDLVMGKLYLEKLKIIKNIFDYELKQIVYTDQFVIFGIPIIETNLNTLLSLIPFISYEIKGIQFRNFNKINETGILLHREIKTRECIFKVMANIEADIYTLYCKDSKNANYNFACIPTYKSSVMMNDIFRCIKENKNLDLLEESDDEEEFENINLDKFVDLNKICYMNCVYNKKFRKWMPVKIIKSFKNIKNNLLIKKDLNLLENKL